MARKVFNINIELNIHAVSFSLSFIFFLIYPVESCLKIVQVTCPGVWLCPNGQITMSIYMLGAITNTLPVEPSFPLLFHERFIYTKVNKCIQSSSLSIHSQVWFDATTCLYMTIP